MRLAELSTADTDTIIATLKKLPRNFREAMLTPEADKWLAACQEEMKSHKHNGTWVLVKPPKGCKPLGNKWVFDIKRDDRFKSRLVALGNQE